MLSSRKLRNNNIELFFRLKVLSVQDLKSKILQLEDEGQQNDVSLLFFKTLIVCEKLFLKSIRQK